MSRGINVKSGNIATSHSRTESVFESGFKMSGMQSFRVFVTNLPWTVGTNSLKKYFSEFGRVSNVQVAFDKKTGLSRGFGFVSFRNEMDYITAVSQKEHILDNKKILVRKKDEMGY